MTSNFKIPRVKDPELLKLLRQKPCAACGQKGLIETHHLRSKGAAGDDDPRNILPLCIRHHSMGTTSIHKLGHSKFFEKFPHVKTYLESIGWEIIDGKLRHPMYAKLDG
jgi:hypothetical protein